MPTTTQCHRIVGAMVSSAALALLLASAGPARAEIIPIAGLLRGVTMTAAQCAARPDTVWVTAFNRSFCIRYYVSTAGGTGTKPIVIFSGDKLGTCYPNAGRCDAGGADIDTEMLVKRADMHSKWAGTTAIYLARIGIDGSSGFHGYRKTRLELHVLNAALDGIKQRHHFEGFHLVGQSGGATIVAGLPALRNDIGCAVPGSGPLNFGDAKQSSDPVLRYADPSDAVGAIAKNRVVRMLVVSDPEDQNVKVERQTTFVRSLRHAGGQVDQLFVQATDAIHHDVVAYAALVVAECVRGMPTPEISLKLAGFVQKRLAHAAPAKTNPFLPPGQTQAQPNATNAPTTPAKGS